MVLPTLGSRTAKEQKRKVGVIFRPYGRKSSVTIRYFPSVQTLIQQMVPHYCPKY